MNVPITDRLTLWNKAINLIETEEEAKSVIVKEMAASLKTWQDSIEGQAAIKLLSLTNESIKLYPSDCDYSAALGGKGLSIATKYDNFDRFVSAYYEKYHNKDVVGFVSRKIDEIAFGVIFEKKNFWQRIQLFAKQS